MYDVKFWDLNVVVKDQIQAKDGIEAIQLIIQRWGEGIEIIEVSKAN